jgi:hypothetical protein
MNDAARMSNDEGMTKSEWRQRSGIGVSLRDGLHWGLPGTCRFDDSFLGAFCAGMIAPRLLFSGERTRPRVSISAPRRNASLQPNRVVGEAPTTAREAHALPGEREREITETGYRSDECE